MDQKHKRPIGIEEASKIIVDTLVPLGAERIALFGSYARGEAKPGSDIDVLVRFPPSGKRIPIGLNWFLVDQELESKLGCHVDLVTEQSLSPLLKSTIERDLLVIYDKAG